MTFPNYLVIGAMKSGTTTLREYLASHPEAYCARETHFFDRHFDRGLDWYRTHFEKAGDRRAIGEKSTGYVYSPVAVERIAEILPDVRLIALLRNPVERAYSHYWMNRRTLSETLPFGEALAAEPERLQRGVDARLRFSYVDRGLYLRQLQHVCHHVPRDRLLVLLFDDLRDARTETLRSAARFLGIDDLAPVPPRSKARANPYLEVRSRRLWGAMFRYRLWRFLPGPAKRAAVRLMSRNAPYPPIEPEVRSLLIGRFAEDNAALGAWLGRDLSSWNG